MSGEGGRPSPRRRIDTFEQWMEKVDRAILARAGVSSTDLADACYQDMFDDGYSPLEAARAVLRGEEE